MNVEEFLRLAAARKSRAVPPAQNQPRGRAELSDAVRAAASRGLRIFPVFETSKYAADSRIKERINDATCDLEKLEEFAAQEPAFFAIATGSGVFAVEMAGELGEAAFNELVTLSIVSLEDEAFGWQTLGARARTSRFAFYRYPAGMTLRRGGKHPAPEITIRCDADYVLLTPDFFFMDPDDTSITPAPQLLLALAFEEIPEGDSNQPPPRILPQSVGSQFVCNSVKPSARSRIHDVRRREFQIRGNSGGWGGKIRISRRR